MYVFGGKNIVFAMICKDFRTSSHISGQRQGLLATLTGPSGHRHCPCLALCHIQEAVVLLGAQEPEASVPLCPPTTRRPASSLERVDRWS